MTNVRTFPIQSMIELKPRFRAAYEIAQWFLQTGKPVELKIVERKSKRSIEQNKRLWAILRWMAANIWIDGQLFSDVVWHEQCKRNFIGMEEIKLPDGSIFLQGISTTTLSVAEFGYYMTQIEAWCANQGYEVAA